MVGRLLLGLDAVSVSGQTLIALVGEEVKRGYLLWSQLEDCQYEANSFLSHFGVKAVKQIAHIYYILSSFFRVLAFEGGMTTQQNVSEYAHTPDVSVRQGHFFVLD